MIEVHWKSCRGKCLNKKVLITGSGIGGLIAGAYLAKSNFKVKIIEKQHYVGGFISSFIRQGHLFEIALHQVTCFKKGFTLYDIFTDLNVFENVEFVEVGNMYRCIYKDYSFVLPCKIKDAKIELKKSFPKEKQSIDKYYEIMENISFELSEACKKKIKIENNILLKAYAPTIAKYKKYTVLMLLDELFDSVPLKVILCANVGFIHDDPYDVDTISHLTNCYHYHEAGVYTIKGGAYRLANYLAKIIRDNGGEIILNHEVIKINHSGSVINNIEYCKTGDNDNCKKDSADIYIGNASLPHIVNQLLRLDDSNSYSKRINLIKLSSSMTQVYLGFNESIINKNFNLSYCNIIVDDKATWVKNENVTGSHALMKGFSFFYKDMADEKKYKPSGTIILLDKMENWKGLDTEAYKNKKKSISNELISKLDEHYPGIIDCIDYVDVSTPKTIERYTNNTSGAGYGFSLTPEQVSMLPGNKTDFDNLFLASAWVYPGLGLSTVSMNAYRCFKMIKDKYK